MAVDTDAARRLADDFPSRIGTYKYTSKSKRLIHEMADEIDELRIASVCEPVVGSDEEG